MRQSLSSLLKSSKPPNMPLMPAIRPVNSISKTAERPIRPPPIAADTGAKFAITLLPTRQTHDRSRSRRSELKTGHAQSQRIADDTHRRKRHGRGGDDRREQNTEMGIEDASRNRDPGGVVDKRKEQVLADVAHGRLREPTGANDAAEIALQ